MFIVNLIFIIATIISVPASISVIVDIITQMKYGFVIGIWPLIWLTISFVVIVVCFILRIGAGLATGNF